ncbi:ribosomal protein subunit S18 [Schizosaccharomyces cryophilus OY26]|uniref:Small ribosomal subunit protein bS18m n=1 Tax=Schizosaccharomyces cryophilus (strain OY26 / ATCC MYA-4695 / CBS 11777 / NBRC 106824 / NRRL Y48691) TaxID=653667 RepID=S9VUY4_SCHCR|nr:ribosomal protein subunit S18 [Schizosaccharomyces cryophilus OY26]EPY49855.1 ribosomal protein subunit S18 [Schizosaccharomyces cryophilus OY26]
MDLLKELQNNWRYVSQSVNFQRNRPFSTGLSVKVPNTPNFNVKKNSGFQRRSDSFIPPFLVPNVSEGQVYSPSDLKFETVEARNQANFFNAKKNDCFKAANKSPIEFWKNPVVLSSFITDLGRIKPRADTGLSAKNQRLVSRAIRRARAVGVLPTKHKSVYAEREK